MHITLTGETAETNHVLIYVLIISENTCIVTTPQKYEYRPIVYI